MRTISLDVDGVISVIPLGLNPGVSRRPRAVPPLPPDAARFYNAPVRRTPLRLAVEWLRFGWRLPARDAREALRDLSARRRIVLTTGRSEKGRPVLMRWLRWHGLASYIDDVHMSPGGLSTRQHKLSTLQRAGIDEHVDDDPTAIWYLAEHGVANLYFRTWRHTRRTESPPGVARIRRLTELLDLIE